MFWGIDHWKFISLMEGEIRVRSTSIHIQSKEIKLKETHMSVKQLYQRSKFGLMSTLGMILMGLKLMELI